MEVYIFGYISSRTTTNDYFNKEITRPDQPIIFSTGQLFNVYILRKQLEKTIK